MKGQERRDKIKKIIITLLLIIIPCNFVLANETNIDVTNDVEFRYKWYKKTLSQTGDYYPLKDITEDDVIEVDKIKYVASFVYSPKHCSLPSEYYQINKAYVRKYQTYKASYVLIENISSPDDIKIYYQEQLLNFETISNENNQIKINLKKEYYCDKLMFEINSESKYKITLYKNENLNEISLVKEHVGTTKLTPDKTWINELSQYTIINTIDALSESDLTKLISKELSCTYKEKYVYAHKSNKEYYDDNYYKQLNLDGYIKDEQDYKIFYIGKPLTITNTIEVIKEKIVKEPQIKYIPKIEYVYLEKNENITITDENMTNEENLEKETDPSNNLECLNNTEIETKIVKEEIFKVPKKIYICVIALIFIILLLLIKLYKKCRLK